MSKALGIEFGSTRIKAILTDDKGKILAEGSHTWENQLGSYEKAVDSYAEVIKMDEMHVDALRALERLDFALEYPP